MKNITIIIPVYNEELSINSLYDELVPIINNNFNEYEVIFIDDGSNDSSFDIINEMVKSKIPTETIAGFFLKIHEFHPAPSPVRKWSSKRKFPRGKIIVQAYATKWAS